MDKLENFIEGFCYIMDGLTLIFTIGRKRSHFILKWNRYLYKKKFGIF